MVFGLFVVCEQIARGEGHYQSTRDGKTLIWNSDPKPGDVVAWSGARDRNDYAHGFGRLVWYTEEAGFDKPQLYARYWGRMVEGKLEGPVNVHSKGKTHYAIFIEGARVTGWTAGTAPSRATARWNMMVAKRSKTNVESASAQELRRDEPEAESVSAERAEPEAPATGPTEEKSKVRIKNEEAASARGSGAPEENVEEARDRPPSLRESIADLYDERWPKIDIDDSIRLLAFPPRSLRR